MLLLPLCLFLSEWLSTLCLSLSEWLSTLSLSLSEWLSRTPPFSPAAAAAASSADCPLVRLLRHDLPYGLLRFLVVL